jgi:hypothetical protein
MTPPSSAPASRAGVRGRPVAATARALLIDPASWRDSNPRMAIRSSTGGDCLRPSPRDPEQRMSTSTPHHGVGLLVSAAVRPPAPDTITAEPSLRWPRLHGCCTATWRGSAPQSGPAG